MPDSVLFDVSGRVGVITLNRPLARNAVNCDVAVGLEAAIDRLEQDDDLWVGVLRANCEGQPNPVFCAGADLKAVQAGLLPTLHTERGGFAGFVFRERTKPIVAAVDGLAIAGGLEIVLSSDLVVASTRSAFGLAEVTRNLIAAAGGLFRLTRAVGQAVAMDAALTGEPIVATRAYELGLLSRLVEPEATIDEAVRVAERIATAAPLAVRASRRVILATGSGRDSTLRQMSDDLLAQLLRTEDLREGLAAFAAKRTPLWQGR